MACTSFHLFMVSRPIVWNKLPEKIPSLSFLASGSPITILCCSGCMKPSLYTHTIGSVSTPTYEYHWSVSLQTQVHSSTVLSRPVSRPVCTFPFFPTSWSRASRGHNAKLCSAVCVFMACVYARRGGWSEVPTLLEFWVPFEGLEKYLQDIYLEMDNVFRILEQHGTTISWLVSIWSNDDKSTSVHQTSLMK